MVQKIPEKIKKEIEAKGGIEKIIKEFPPKKDIKKIAFIHHALSDEIRLKILFFLNIQESCVCLIKEITGLSYSKLSYHLKILKDAGLIKSRKLGNYIIYSISKKGKFFIDKCMIK